MRAIGYLRVSTQEQAEEGVSLGAQRAKINAWCAVSDYHLGDIFEDAGISGSRTSNRPGLITAIEALNKGDALVVYSLSRFARSTRDTLDLAEQIERKGADLVSLTERIDTTTAAGKMVFRMLAVLAEFERDQISERTKAALAHKKSKGERIGTVPYGYQLDSDGIRLVSNASEQEVLHHIGKLRRIGYPLRAISDQLNRDGIKTRRGSQWRHQYIDNLLGKFDRLLGKTA